MDAREMAGKNRVYGRSGRRKLLSGRAILCLCLVMLVLTFISSCRGRYYTDYDGNVVNSRVARHYNRGQVYLKEGDYARAIAEYTRAIEIEPAYYSYYRRGYAYFSMGQFDQAIADFTRALEIRQEAYIYYQRGDTYLSMGQFDQAIADANKAIELDPHDASAYFLKAVAYDGINRKKKAIEAYGDFIKHASPREDSQNIEFSKKRITELKNSPVTIEELLSETGMELDPDLLPTR